MQRGQRVGYVRVSTLDQSTDRQLDGMALDRTFTDKASGKDTQRPELQQALAYVRQGDTLVVHSMDRLARNAEDLLRIVRELTERGVGVEFVKNRLTFSGGNDPMAKLTMTMLAGFAEFERSLIRERQREGIAIAKQNNVYKGRARTVTDAQIAEMRRRAAAGEKKATIARDLGISRETLYQYIRDQDKAAAARPMRAGQCLTDA